MLHSIVTTLVLVLLWMEFLLVNGKTSFWKSWCTSEMLKPGTSLQKVIERAITKFQGRLRLWWISLGDLRQRQVKHVPNLDTFFEILHTTFLGSWGDFISQAREEYLSIKCCSFNKKDL